MAALFNGLRKFSGPTTGSHSFAVRTTNRLPHIPRRPPKVPHPWPPKLLHPARGDLMH